MQLYEKLTFMMDLTQTTNRMLARELQVDPSLISRLRTGSRGVPRNREYLKIMAHFFTKRCTTKYQRQALSEILGINLSSTAKNDQLSEILYYWLLGDSDGVGRFMRTFENLTFENGNTDSLPESCSVNTSNTLYFNSEGKRVAARTLSGICSHWMSPVPFYYTQISRMNGSQKIQSFFAICRTGG